MKAIEIDGKSYLIDIEKATEQGLLKEKDSKPHSWEEYEKNNAYGYIPDIMSRYNYFNSIEEANAFCALGKLIQLRDAWWGDWKPEFMPSTYDGIEYGCICRNVKGNAEIIMTNSRPTILTFETPDIAQEFFDTYKDLIEEAKMFL